MNRPLRIDIALVLLAGGIIFNVLVLIEGEASPGWPIATIVLLGVACLSLLRERGRL